MFAYHLDHGLWLIVVDSAAGGTKYLVSPGATLRNHLPVVVISHQCANEMPKLRTARDAE